MRVARLTRIVGIAVAVLSSLSARHLSAQVNPVTSGVTLVAPSLSSDMGGSPPGGARSIIVLKDQTIADVAVGASGPSAAAGAGGITARGRRAAALHAMSLRQKHRRMISALSSKRVRVRHNLSVSLNALVVDRKLSFAEASALLPGEVVAVYEDRPVRASLDSSVPVTNAPLVWAQSAPDGQPLTGRGVRIAVIDTGIDYTHPDLGGCSRTSNIAGGSCAKVVGGYDFVNNDGDPFDDHGHGTHCAATAAGNGALRGVAPDAKLYAYKVLAAQGWGSMSDVIAAIERSVDPNGDGSFDDRLDVISLSLGSDSGSPDEVDSLALDRAVSLGVVAVVAAGNSGPAQETIGSPGTSRRAITVGATSNTGELADFSSRGPVRFSVLGEEHTLLKPDLVAPGVRICAARSSQTARQGNLCHDNAHEIMSGTSMATPHVAGVAALVRQAHPTWSPDEVKSALKRGGSRLLATAAERLQSVGVGMIDAASAVAAQRGAVALEQVRNDAAVVTLFARVPVGWGYTVSASPYATLGELSNGEWIELVSGVATTAEFSLATDISALGQGIHALELRAIDPQGGTLSDFSEIEVRRLELSSPKDDDVVNAVDPLLVHVRRLSSVAVEGLSIEYSVDGGEWSSVGVTVDPPNLSGTISLPSGSEPYTVDVRARVTQGGREHFVLSKRIRVDPRLKSGFPVRVDQECGNTPDWGPVCQPNWVVHPVVADIEGDGHSEILVWRKRLFPHPNEILIIDSRGSIQETIPLDAHPLQRELGQIQLVPRPPLATDLDGDGRTEIVVAQSYAAAWGVRHYDVQWPTVLTVYNSDRSVRAGFPVIVEGVNASLISADLNRDGRKEIILRTIPTEAGVSGSVAIVGDDGTVMSDLAILQESGRESVTGLDEGRDSMVGDFDGDDELEVVVFTNSYSPSAPGFDIATSAQLVNWGDFGERPASTPTLPGMLFGSGVPVTSDVGRKHTIAFPSLIFDRFRVGVHSLRFNDGGIAVSSTTLDPLSGSCSPAPGIACGFYNSGFSLGALGGATSPVPIGSAEGWYRGTAQLHTIVGSNVGTAIAPSFPSRTTDSPPVFADVSGDGINDIIFLSNMQANPITARGISAFTSESGYTTALNFATERGFYPSTSFPPSATDLDGDGRTDIVTASLGDGYLDRPLADSSKRRFSIYAFGSNGTWGSTQGAWTRFRGNADSNGCVDCEREAIRAPENAPVITVQPIGGSVAVGGHFELRVAAQGAGLRYQWQSMKVGASEYEAAGWYDLPGGNQSTFSLSPSRVGEVAYRVRVSNATRSTLSSAARVTVEPYVESRICPLDALKSEPGVCGCSEADIDDDKDGKVDCLERRAYSNLGRASVRRARVRGRYLVTVPSVPGATSYRVAFTHSSARRVRIREASRVSRSRRFIINDLPAGTYRVTWAATIQGVPGLLSASGEPSTARLK